MTDPVQGQRLRITRFYEPEWRKTKSKQSRMVKVYRSNDNGGEYVFDSATDKSSHNGGTFITPEAIQEWAGVINND